MDLLGDPQLTQDLRGFAPAADIVVSYLLAEIELVFSALDHLDLAGAACWRAQNSPPLGYTSSGATARE